MTSVRKTTDWSLSLFAAQEFRKADLDLKNEKSVAVFAA